MMSDSITLFFRKLNGSNFTKKEKRSIDVQLCSEFFLLLFVGSMLFSVLVQNVILVDGDKIRITVQNVILVDGDK